MENVMVKGRKGANSIWIFQEDEMKPPQLCPWGYWHELPDHIRKGKMPFHQSWSTMSWLIIISGLVRPRHYKKVAISWAQGSLHSSQGIYPTVLLF
jgi:hypothetical protein